MWALYSPSRKQLKLLQTKTVVIQAGLEGILKVAGFTHRIPMVFYAFFTAIYATLRVNLSLLRVFGFGVYFCISHVEVRFSALRAWLWQGLLYVWVGPGGILVVVSQYGSGFGAWCKTSFASGSGFREWFYASGMVLRMSIVTTQDRAEALFHSRTTLPIASQPSRNCSESPESHYLFLWDFPLLL